MAAARKGRTSPSGPTSNVKHTVTFAGGNAAADGVTVVTPVPLVGARTTDVVRAHLTAALPAGAGLLGARISAADVLDVSFVNPTAAIIALGNVTLTIELERYNA
jgi:hypothetical protein